MLSENFQIKKDKFRDNRGSYSRIMNLFCRECGAHLAVYQKDGPGNLRRLYMDRIYAPLELTGLESKNLEDVKDLKCVKCGETIGTPYIYPKEKRKAFKVYQDAIVKKVRKAQEVSKTH